MLPIIVIFDFIYFRFSLENFYKPRIGHILSEDFNYAIAAIFYILYSAGISYLILLPGFEYSQSILRIFFNSFIFGVVAYGTYDLTNQATIKDWPAIVTIVDMLWGGFVTASASGLTYKFAMIFKVLHNR